MKLVSVTMIKNDGDIVEAFVRHHLSLLDHVVILDHGSTDSTPRILRALQAENLRLTVLNDDSLSFQQGPRVTELARQAFSRLGADFVLPLDADEFLRVDSRSVLEEALAGIPAGRCGQIAWRNHVVTEQDDVASLNPVERMKFRASFEPREEHKVVLSRTMIEDPRWEVSPGSHYLTRVSPHGTETAVASYLPTARLAHYPIRSQEQLHQKIILGWLAYRLQDPVDIKAANTSVSADAQFWHWKDLFASILNDPVVSTAKLQQYALALYVNKRRISDSNPPMVLTEDPLPTHYSLKYTQADTGVALASLARWTDQLLTRVGEML